jgi:hypothetical protein
MPRLYLNEMRRKASEFDERKSVEHEIDGITPNLDNKTMEEIVLGESRRVDSARELGAGEYGDTLCNNPTFRATRGSFTS